MDVDHVLNTDQIDTPLGPMIAIGDAASLYLLEFLDRRSLVWQIEMLSRKTKKELRPGKTPLLLSVKHQLDAYFQGDLSPFQIPLFLQGSSFQIQVWQKLQTLSLGQTCSYADLAFDIGKPRGARAVARANSANRLAILIPCHRVIYESGELGGYAGGIVRKKWLLDHERSIRKDHFEKLPEKL